MNLGTVFKTQNMKEIIGEDNLNYIKESLFLINLMVPKDTLKKVKRQATG